MIQAIKSVVSSKGLWKAIIGSAIVGGLAYLHAPNELLAIVGSLFGTTVIAQGMSDLGKSAKP